MQETRHCVSCMSQSNATSWLFGKFVNTFLRHNRQSCIERLDVSPDSSDYQTNRIHYRPDLS